MKKNKLWTILTAVMAVLLVISIVAIPVTNAFATVINVTLGATTQEIIPDPDAEIYFWTNYESEEDLVAYEKALCATVEGEGAALLVNRDNTLPLAEGVKITPFSQSSFNLMYGGTGSGQVKADDAVSLKAAFDAAFGEDTVNPDQWKFYATAGYKRVNADTTGGNQAQYRINEVPWEKYSDALKGTWANYGDVALVVLARSGGEGADLPSGLPELSEYMTDGDYLRLCKEEIEMFENLEQLKKDGTFKKIVVLLNSSNALQLDFVDDYGIDAVLWIGDVGMTGINAVADILAGKINPSGRIVDTFLKDNHSAPAMQNFGAYKYTNAAEYDTATAQNNTDPGIGKCNSDFLVYAEGIYVGYRYFETRYEDYVLNRGNAGDYKYDDDVAFPFGFGLSYTEFEYSNFAIEDKGQTIEVNVDVTNVGDMDGKHTVQIYFQSPYTQYDIDNLVEKAAVEICGFDKKMIAAGATEHFTITVNKEDLTSYDYMKARTYILDGGDYYFTVGRNAHDAINNILMAKGADASRMNGSGDATLTAKWTLDKMDTTTYAVSSKTGKPITNLFDDANLNFYAGADGQTVTYLTRNDWVGTWPSTASLRITETMWADGLTHEESGRVAIVEKMKQKYYADVTTVPAMGVSGNLTAGDLVMSDVDDPRWAELISQIPYTEMTNLIYNGFHLTQPVPSINLPGTNDENGPQGFTKGLVGGNSAMAYTSEDVMAATFNLELLNEVGKCIGEDFMHATDGSGTAFSGIYGPGANIHRTAYSGRNFEYYSEDGWLSGKMAAAEVKGIQDRGVYVFTKHFALNDQEEGRYGISTWSNEQAIREIYLEGFEGSIVEGDGMGVMSSFNRIGVIWAGAHHGLMTGILRDEWGFQGTVICDFNTIPSYMNSKQMAYAGGDLNLATQPVTWVDTSDVSDLIVLRQCAKNILYTVANSNAMNGEIVGYAMPIWEIALYAIDCVAAAGIVIYGVAALLKKKKTQQ